MCCGSGCRPAPGRASRCSPGGLGALICLDRGAYLQCALVVPEGSAESLRARGMEDVRRHIRLTRPELADRVRDLHDGDLHELRVRVDHLPRWHRPGVLCIGDAAHAMSPAGGVGINLAIQDAVAAARLLGPVLERGGSPSSRQLDSMRRRRLLAARITQWVQHRALVPALPRVLDDVRTTPPLGLRAVAALPVLQRAMGRLIGIGLRPEPAPGTERGARQRT